MVRRALAETLRAHPDSTRLQGLAKAVDGSVWRRRPTLKEAHWTGLEAYRGLSAYAEGALVYEVAVASVDGQIKAVEEYDARVAGDAAAREEDAIRAQADPAGKGLSFDKVIGPFHWLAPAGVASPNVATQVPVWEAAIRYAWPFVAKKPLDASFQGKRLAVILAPEVDHYDWTSDGTERYLGVVKIPHGDAPGPRVAAAAGLCVAAYEAAFRLDVARNRENLRHVLAMRWGLAFASYPSDITPLSFPVMRDRGHDALLKVIGKSPKVPAFGTILDAARQEDIRLTGTSRIADLDPLPRAAYVFLAYRMLMRWRIMEPWSEEQMRALAEIRPIPMGQGAKGPISLGWDQFVEDLRAAADRPRAAQAAGLEGLVGLNLLFTDVYMPFVLGEISGSGGAIDGR